MIQRTVLFMFLVQCQLSLAWADDWPQWRGPDRTGVSKEKGLLPSWPRGGPRLLWTFRDAGLGYSCMSVVGDRLYSMGSDGDKDCVYAIDLNNQKKLWSTEVGPSTKGRGYPGPRGTPTIDGNFLYTIGYNGDLVCVDTVTGKKIWSQALQTGLDGKSPGYGYSESPLVDGDVVVATPGGPKGALAAFDKKTGTLKWRSTGCTYRSAYSSAIAIVVGGVRQYVQIPDADSYTDGAVIGVRADDGKLLWEFPFHFAVSTPLFHNDCIYVSSCQDGCKLVKLVAERDQCKAEPIYTNQAMKNHLGGVVAVGEHLYGYSDRGLMCQNFKTGRNVWISKKGGGKGSITFADGYLYCHHANPCGVMVLIKATPDGYQEQGTFRIPERSKLEEEGSVDGTYTCPVVANGKLYLREHELIFCYDIRKSPQ